MSSTSEFFVLSTNQQAKAVIAVGTRTSPQRGVIPMKWEAFKEDLIRRHGEAMAGEGLRAGEVLAEILEAARQFGRQEDARRDRSVRGQDLGTCGDSDVRLR